MFSKLSLRVAAAALAAGAALFSTAPAAFAANPTGAEGAVTASNPGGAANYGSGYNNVINGHSAAARNLVVEGGDTIVVYCVQEGVSFADADSAVFTALTWSASGVSNPAKAAGIAVKSASIGTPLADANSEAAAVQLAVWHYSSGLDYSGVGNAAIVARADELVAAAPEVSQGLSSFVLTATAVLSDKDEDPSDDVVAHKTAVVTATLTGNGNPIEGATLELPTVGDTLTATTDASGVATFKVPVGTATTDAEVRYTGTLKAGSILAPVDGQIVVTTEDASITRTASVTLPAQEVVVSDPKPTETPTPTETPKPTAQPTPTPTPTATKTPDELPYTGTWLTPTMIALAAAAAVGGLGLRRYMNNR